MRRILTAHVLAVGSEILVGETVDTNSGAIARDLAARGVEVLGISALRDRLEEVREAIDDTRGSVDLVVTTGGLGPTPDDLTREAIAASLGETPTMDPDLERWLRSLFERRGVAFPEANMKQAWLIPSATALPNDHGTAPGWWVERDDAVIVALPGPPREMRPMWHAHVVPRLIGRGLGSGSIAVTLRTTGVGESVVADRIQEWLAGHDPEVATYARGEAVDIRIWGAAPRVAAAEQAIRSEIGDAIWATGETTWADAIRDQLARREWQLAVVEIGTRGAIASLLGEGLAERVASLTLLAERPRDGGGSRRRLESLAAEARERTGADVVLVVEAATRGSDTRVSVHVATPTRSSRARRVVFLAGVQGRSRAAVTAAAILLSAVRSS